MTERLRNKCDLFLRNRNAVSKKFMLEKGMMSIAAGLIFTGADKEADIEKLTECRKLLNKHTGFFSEYRDAVKLALLSEMALSEAPEQYIEDVKAVYKKLHKGKFRNNSYMRLHVDKWKENGAKERVLRLVDAYGTPYSQAQRIFPM